MRKLLVKPGVQKNGQIVTRSELQEAVANFNPDAPTPITLGHPTDSQSPAFGRVLSVELTDQGLEGDVDYTPELVALEAKGYYRGWSAGLKPGQNGYYLHHLAMCGELPPASEVKNLSMVATWPTDIILTDNMEDATMTPEEVKQLIADETKEYKDKITALEAQVAAAKQKDGKGQEGGEKAGDGEKDKPSDKDGKGEKPGSNKPDNKGNDEKQSKELADVLEALKKERIERLKEAAQAKGLGADQIKPLVAMVASAKDISLADADNPFEQAMRFVAGLPTPGKGRMTAPIELSDKTGEPYDYNGLAGKM
jgi:hypothetical protein